MQFLKTLFWVVIAVVAAVFGYRNWTQVTLDLWGGLQADVKLPVLMLVAFLVGLLPGVLLHRATRWRLGRRLAQAERNLAELRPVEPAMPIVTAAPEPAAAPLPLIAGAPPLVP